MVTLTQLEELIRFAECGTLSGAAEKCHISQPALSRSMQKLEDDFGVPLFNRGKNRTALNACGRLAAEGARRIISGVQGVLENVRALDRRLRTISAGSSLGYRTASGCSLPGQNHFHGTQGGP